MELSIEYKQIKSNLPFLETDLMKDIGCPRKCERTQYVRTSKLLNCWACSRYRENPAKRCAGLVLWVAARCCQALVRGPPGPQVGVSDCTPQRQRGLLRAHLETNLNGRWRGRDESWDLWQCSQVPQYGFHRKFWGELTWILDIKLKWIESVFYDGNK